MWLRMVNALTGIALVLFAACALLFCVAGGILAFG